MRRTLIIAAVVIAFIGIGALIYFYFFAKPAVTTAPGGPSLPEAGQGPPGAGTTPGGGDVSTPAPVTVSPRLVKISAGPVVPGAAVINTRLATASSTGETAVNYIERASGNVFSYLTSTKTLRRISNKTIPGIESAAWLPSGSVAFVRYLSGAQFSTINTYALSASSSTSFFLSQNLADIAVSSAGILTLASGVNGSVASLLRPDGTNPIQVFTTPLSAIRISFLGKSQYLAYTKPSGALPGAAFLVEAGHFSRIAGPKNGLVALASPLGAWVLMSSASGSTLQMELVDASTGEALSLPVATIADKCVWAADDLALYCGIPMDPPSSARYPDDWYQGAVHFSDRIWKIDTAGRYAQLVLDFPKETESDLDAEALALDPANTTLVFVNKNDSSLWAYSL